MPSLGQVYADLMRFARFDLDRTHRRQITDVFEHFNMSQRQTPGQPLLDFPRRQRAAQAVSAILDHVALDRATQKIAVNHAQVPTADVVVSEVL